MELFPFLGCGFTMENLLVSQVVGVRNVGWTFALFISLAILGGVSWLYYTLLVATPSFTDLQTQVPVTIKLANGKESKRMVGPSAPGWVPLDSISPYLVHAVIAQEDASFYLHKGVDYFEIKEAVKRDLKEKRYARGASTITQQVVKNVFLSREKSLWRKVKEFVWAREMEKALSKHKILSFYLNMVELGPGIYGVGRASQYYFGISPSGLNLKQAAFLALLLPSPTKYHNHYFEKKQLTEWANKRINHTLHVMLKMNFINQASYDAAMGEELWGGSVPDIVENLDIRPLYEGETSEAPLEEVPPISPPPSPEETDLPPTETLSPESGIPIEETPPTEEREPQQDPVTDSTPESIPEGSLQEGRDPQPEGFDEYPIDAE